MPRATETEAVRSRGDEGLCNDADDDDDDVYYREDERGWVRQRTAWASDGLCLVVEENHLQPAPWHHGVNKGCGIGISLRGAYRRRVRGVEQVVDCNTGFLRFDGDEVGVEHFNNDPGAVTYVGADPEVHGGWFDAVAEIPAFTVTPPMAFTHMRMLRAQRLGADKFTMEPLALDLLRSSVLQHADSVSSYARRSTSEARRRLVAEACELLHVGHRKIGLVEIARTVSCSPFHLSRVFREITGVTIPQYRKRLRVHEALRRLNDGENDLATIAVSSGFADHSHMTRSIVAQYGNPPSRLRELMEAYAATSRIFPR